MRYCALSYWAPRYCRSVSSCRISADWNAFSPIGRPATRAASLEEPPSCEVLPTPPWKIRTNEMRNEKMTAQRIHLKFWALSRICWSIEDPRARVGPGGRVTAASGAVSPKRAAPTERAARNDGP